MLAVIDTGGALDPAGATAMPPWHADGILCGAAMPKRAPTRIAQLVASVSGRFPHQILRIVVLPRAFHDALRVVEDPLSASRIRSISLRLREFCAPDEGGFSAQGTAISLVSFPQVLMEPELAIVVIETGKVRRILPEPALGQSVSRSWTCCCGIAQFTSVAVFLAMH